MALIEHTFLGTWEIVSCTFEGVKEISGLEGIKFRLDDNSDITWYNDLINPLVEASDSNSSCCDSAKVLFTCETFEVNENQPRLIFGAFAGHSIEFNVPTLTPDETLMLSCETWYTLECKRLKNDQAAGQEKEFTFIECLNDSYFSDVIIKSSDGYEYRVHACILRLNGFDCSMYVRNSNSPCATQQIKLESKKNTCANAKVSVSNNITISVTLPNTTNLIENKEKVVPLLKLSPIHLKLPSEHNMTEQFNSKLSSSYNCLLSSYPRETNHDTGNQLTFNNIGCMDRISSTSRSDSYLDSNNLQHHQQRNVFNFCPDIMWQQLPLLDNCNTPSNTCSSRHPPLSPYRAKSPLLFSTSAIDTPPSSPLTPVSVLYDLPAFLLTPILHWLYTETLLSDMDENVCEKLINFAENQPSLTKMTESFKKYSKLIKLKKFVISIIMNLHNVLNRAIQTINPVTVSRVPLVLYDTFKDCIKDCLIGCAKILQFCNIFVKDAADMARYQKNEIIKYVRSRVPIFASQLQQLLDNVLKVFLHLQPEEKSDLAYFLIPKIESALLTLANLVGEIKISLEKMCKDLKCSHLDTPSNHKADGKISPQLLKNSLITNEKTIVDEQAVNDIFDQQPRLKHYPRRGQFLGLTLHDNLTNKNPLMGAENDLKFVLYMFEMRKMRDVYGRISMALGVIRDKKDTFIGLDFVTKHNTIYENIDNLISYIPNYINILETLAKRVDGKLGWKEFKFFFKLVTSQINGVLVKILDHKVALKGALTQICKLVDKQDFTESLIDLGLLEQSNILETELNSLRSDSLENLDLSESEYKKIKLNLVRHLCESPTAAQSNLSKNALRLLHSTQLTDMEFVVHSSDNSGNTLHPKEFNAQSPNIQVHTFRAHRVIVASRCDCFKKALMSGMQESITRKIIISDTSPVIFRRLLLYLYGAPIDKTVGAEQICELMLLADRYSIIDLKELCENTLNALIDEHSVLCLLGIADHYLAAGLKTKCLSFLAQNSHITKTVLFKELTQSLQLEVMDLIHWYGRVTEPWNEQTSDLSGFRLYCNSRSSVRSAQRSKIHSRKLSPN